MAFVTCDRQPELFEEERELIPRALALGIAAQPAVWTDPAVDWGGYDLLVIRSTWDYFERIDEFLAWLSRVESIGAPLQNPIGLVRWNLDKRYLRQLEAAGTRIVPTRFVEPGEPCDLAALVAERGWETAVLKPAVAGGAFCTHRFERARAASHQPDLELITKRGAALIQPFIPEVISEGEWSLLFFGGVLCHAVLKAPAAGDYRVQTQHGGSFRLVQPPAALVAAARAIIARLPESPLYVRIDGVRRAGEFLLMEVEAIEPYLFFAARPEAMDRYLGCIAGVLGSR